MVGLHSLLGGSVTDLNNINLLFGIIASFVCVLGALVTTVVFVIGARASARRANERVTTIAHELSKVETELKGEIAKIEAKHESLDSKIVNELGEIKIALGRIQGRLGIDGKSI